MKWHLLKDLWYGVELAEEVELLVYLRGHLNAHVNEVLKLIDLPHIRWLSSAIFQQLRYHS